MGLIANNLPSKKSKIVDLVVEKSLSDEEKKGDSKISKSQLSSSQSSESDYLDE